MRKEGMIMGIQMGYEPSEEDVANVLASNWSAVANTNGISFESMAAELLPQLKYDLIEDAAMYGDTLDEQTNYANDEIARQLHVLGILETVQEVHS
jgi:hypothetical protein